MTDLDDAIPLALISGPDRWPARRQQFAERVRNRELLMMPGVSDALSARLVQYAGFDAAYVTGAGIANLQYAIPDIGLLGLEEVAAVARRVCDAVRIPMLIDADTGYGGTLAAMRTVHTLEAAGAAAIQLEDQVSPKRCGHFGGQNVIGTEEMVAKIRAMLAARCDDNLILIARTDALGVLGEDEAIRRGQAYLDAGADALFVEAPRTVEQLDRIGREFAGVPLVANVVEGGLTPQLSAPELADLGFTIVLFANFLMRVVAKTATRALSVLHDTGDSRGLADEMLTWTERQELVELHIFQSLEQRLELTVSNGQHPVPRSDGRAS